jgi:hypothetical protein
MRLLLACLLCCSLGAVAAEPAKNEIEITLAHNSPLEAQTKQQLDRLLKQYDLRRWYFTHAVVIDERAIPHSHPVLTLHTRHLKDDELTVSAFVHEQLHWWLDAHEDETKAAVEELRALFPKVPVGGMEGGDTETSTYEHLLVCFLEQNADLQLLGELRTHEVMEFWATDHYTWIYKTVLERGSDIRAIILKHNLVPPRV